MTFIFRSLIISGAFSFAVPAVFVPNPSPAQANTAPVVRITSPANGELYAPGALVPYTVTVSDKEDGESKYEEIPATEVFLELRYFSDPAKAAAFRKTDGKENPGYAMFKKSDCYNCHAVHTKVIGPSFSDIAAKYKKPEDLVMVATHIMKGSTGIWGTAVMPTHPDLSETQARLIARWIVAAGQEGTTDFFRGAEGAFHLPPVKPGIKGHFLLKATYLDHGSDKNGTGALAGQDLTALKFR